MASCPKCGRKLHLYDWRPECPDCHVNMVYYKSNERLLEETEKTEIEHSKFQPKVDRAKAATIGTTIGKIRMAFFLLPIAVFFLPLLKITISGEKKNFSAIDAVSLFSAVDFGKLFNNITPFVLMMLFLAIPAVCCIVFTIMQIAGGTKKGLRKNIVLSSISIALVAASLICQLLFAQSPVDDYASLLLNEADYAVSQGDQAGVDAVSQKILKLYKDNTVDKTILERAIINGEKRQALSGKSSVASRLNEEELKTLAENIENGKKVLADTNADIDAVRDAADAINSSNFTCSYLEESILAATHNAVEHDDEVYEDSYYNDLLTKTDYTAKQYLNEAIAEAKVIAESGTFSENSYNGLTGSIEAAEALLNNYLAGNPIIELEDDDGSGMKTDKEIAMETAQTIQNAYADLNGKICGLVDTTVIDKAVELLNKDIDEGMLYKFVGQNISVAPGIGIFVLLLFYIAQLIFNIIVNKKGINIKYTTCYIGMIPSDEYFADIENGVSELEIRQKMVKNLTEMQDKVRAEAAEAEQKALDERANRR